MQPNLAEYTDPDLDPGATTRTSALTVRFDWVPLGAVSLDAYDRLDFPRAPSVPGVYQFALAQDGSSLFYIGQADNIARRLQHYRTPGPSQQTNIRLNRLMTDTLAAGGRVTLSMIAANAAVDVHGKGRSINLGSKFERVLLEHAAIYFVIENSHTSLNQ